MIQRVYEAARAAEGLDDVIIATDSDEIMQLCERNGWNAEESAAPIDGEPAAPLDGQPVEQMPGGHMPVEHVPFEPAMTADSAPPPPPSFAPAIAPPPEPVVAQAPQPVPEPVGVRADPPPPVVPTISADAPPEKPKRGWWRR